MTVDLNPKQVLCLLQLHLLQMLQLLHDEFLTRPYLFLKMVLYYVM